MRIRITGLSEGLTKQAGKRQPASLNRRSRHLLLTDFQFPIVIEYVLDLADVKGIPHALSGFFIGFRAGRMDLAQ